MLRGRLVGFVFVLRWVKLLMSAPYGQWAFSQGEISPGLYGRVDLARFKVGASTQRNMFTKFSGGAYSRAGTAYTGFSKQTGRSYPPRLIPFQFSISQGLALEFGNQYFRIIKNGTYVTEGPLPVLGITQASPAVLTTASSGAQSATSNDGAVTATYAPGDLVTLAGGTPAIPAVLRVTNTELLSTTVLSPGTGGYAPTNTINVNGGVQTVSTVLTVLTTQVVSATVTAGGSGGTNGQQTVTGTTGTGTLFTALVIIAGGAITSVISISLPGSYTVNPTTIAAEPVTGAGLTGATLSVSMGVATVSVTTAGTFTTNPVNGALTQSSTSGAGIGATFNMSILGPRAVSISNAGSYGAFPPNPVAQASTTGSGLGATFTVTPFTTQPYQVGDWVSVTAVAGMTQINNQVYVVGAVTMATISLFDVYGNPINSTAFNAYISGGQVARIYTAVSPYAEADLAWLKIAQSNDVMSICCINQDTDVSYQPQDLERFSDIDWTFTPVVPGPTIVAPTGVGVTASSSGSSTYGFIVTAVGADGSESLGSTPAFVQSAVDIFATAGTVTVSWAAVPKAVGYNVYQYAISFSTPQPSGTPCGIVATGITATSWQNSNIEPDFTQVPPQFNDPFPGPAEYPSVVSYFQERRAYASSLSLPDNYFLSQPGSFTNFDQRTPPIDSDAVIGAPWGVQVNGIQFMVQRPGGLVVLTGNDAWQLTGTGGSSLNPVAITPTSQQAQQQSFNGCSNHVPPLGIVDDIVYVPSKGSAVRRLSYQIYANNYTGDDITLNSSHLFNFYNVQEWCYAEEPYKMIWAVRTDGALLSCTYIKAEQIVAWARHDTQGSFASICSITELPVNAVYVAVQRQIGSNTAYVIERMDDRLWSSIDDAWCVDCGQALAQPQPAATLMIGSSAGIGSIGPMTVQNGGTGWSNLTTVQVTDNNGQGPGTGAAVVPVIMGGVITGLTGGGGAGYVNPQFTAIDPAGSDGGSGFAATCVLQNTVTLKVSGGVFSIGNIGSVIRAAGGIAMITGFTSATQVTANVIVPFTGVLPIDNNTVSPTPTESFTPVQSGNWSMTQPVSTVSGLNYLAGASVVGLADGQPFGPVTVSAQGTINLATPASNVVVGMSFLPQLQSLYLDTGTSPTTQGQRKKPAAATLRTESSRGFQAGTNQVDGSTLSPPQIGPAWGNLTAVPDLGVAPYGTSYVPLATGDIRVALPGGYGTKAQIAVQQPSPMPLNILSYITELDEGDVPQMHAPRQQQNGNVAQA